MKTQITSRKTPHSVSNTVFGTVGTDLVEAWCFEFNNFDDEIVKRWIPKSQCYVRDNLQDQPDYAFSDGDIRKFHVDVWNAKCANWKRTGKWMTDRQLEKYLNSLHENIDNAESFMKNFE